MNGDQMPGLMRKSQSVKKPSLRGFLNAFKSQDIFGQGYHMKLDQGKSVLKSLGGAICSIILFATILGFTLQKVKILMNRNDTDILSTKLDLHYANDEIFSYSNGLNIAVAFSEYNSERE